MTPGVEFITTGIAIWGAVCILATAGLVVLSPRIGRLRAAAWMITIAALLLIEEDPILLIFMASNGPTVDRDGVLGLVHAHTRAHMLGGAAWTAGAMLLSVLVAHRWLATGARQAWTALLGVLAIGAAGDLFMLTVYPHGLEFLPAPDDGVIGFGWPTLLAGLAIWAFALAYSYAPLFAASPLAGTGLHAPRMNGRLVRVPLKKIALVAAYLGAILLVPMIVMGANVISKLADSSEPLAAPAYTGALPAPPTPDWSKKFAVVLSGPRGSEIGDTLEAYEVLARSEIFNVYSVAPERTVLSLQPGTSTGGSSLDFVPHFSFAEYDAQIGRAPDLIVVPWSDGGYSPQRDAVTLDWIRGHFGPNTTILGICFGTKIVSDTGLLDGRTATTNTQTFSYVQGHAPTATLLHDLRYFDDGNIVTSSNLTAGIDATLHVVDRFAGRTTALDVARQIGYTQTAALDDPAFQPPDSRLANGFTVGLEGPKQQLGILLYDGVTELGQSGLIDPVTLSARTFVMAPERRIVQSHDGFVFLPRYDFGTVPALDRVLVPAGENAAARQQVVAGWSASHPGQPAEDIYTNVGSGETAYDATLRDLAHTHNGVLARATADGLFYTANAQDFSGASWPVNEVVAGLALMLLGAAIAFAATHLRATFRSLATAVFVVGLIVTTACSGTPSAGASANAADSRPISAAVTGAQQVTLSVGKGMNFEPAEITVRAGQPVDLTLRNDGQFPHDFTLTEGVAQPVKITVNGGETAIGTFTLNQRGTYNFECSMPAHALAGMRGTITAQ